MENERQEKAMNEKAKAEYREWAGDVRKDAAKLCGTIGEGFARGMEWSVAMTRRHPRAAVYAGLGLLVGSPFRLGIPLAVGGGIYGYYRSKKGKVVQAEITPDSGSGA